jgi:hypothetical protein
VENDQCPTCLGDAVRVLDVDTQRMIVEHLHCPVCQDPSDAQDRLVSAIDDSDNAFFHLARLHQGCWDQHRQSLDAPEQGSPHTWHEGEFRSMLD